MCQFPKCGMLAISSMTRYDEAVLKDEPQKQGKRHPVSLEHLYALHNHLDLTNSFDAAAYAVACCAFWGCRRCALASHLNIAWSHIVFRLGELVVPSANAFDPTRHVSKAANLCFHTPPSGKAYATLPCPGRRQRKLWVHLPSSQTSTTTRRRCRLSSITVGQTLKFRPPHRSSHSRRGQPVRVGPDNSRLVPQPLAVRCGWLPISSP